MRVYSDHWFTSADGLKLYARFYASKKPRGRLICIPGLTRNSADFEDFCQLYAADMDIACLDLRGRGESQYDENINNYNPAKYAEDVMTLMESLNWSEAILAGTSLGGLVSMLLAAMHPARVQKLIINDIGPDVNPEGLERILEYVCAPRMVQIWPEAINRTKQLHSEEFPDYRDEDWTAFTQRLYREDDQGRPVLNYDVKIADSMRLADTSNTIDFWPIFDMISETPTLLVHGVLSNVLSQTCVAKMQAHNSKLRLVQVPRTGHAPTLIEPECVPSINDFLEAG